MMDQLKLQRAATIAALFFVLSQPGVYRITDQLFESTLGIDLYGITPTQSGIAVHAAVAGLIGYGLMNLRYL